MKYSGRRHHQTRLASQELPLAFNNQQHLVARSRLLNIRTVARLQET
jgi:hypothetical protein